MSRRYSFEKLSSAMVHLIGEGSLRDRLYGALTSVRTLKATAEDFPDPDDRHRWAELQERMTAAAPAADLLQAHRATIDAMGEGELRDVAEDLLALFSAAAQELGADNEERKGMRQRRRS